MHKDYIDTIYHTLSPSAYPLVRNFLKEEIGMPGRLTNYEQDKPKQKVIADKWIANDMIFIARGEGFGVADNGATVCIGSEKDIQSYLDGGVMPDSIRGRGRQVLIEIKEVLKGEEDARANTGESFRAIKARHQRSRPAKHSQRRAAGSKSTPSRKRLPGSKAK
jgi:hypothetical protein